MPDTIYVKPRTAERITMFCSIATLAIVFFIAFMGNLAFRVGGEAWQAATDFQPIGSAVNAQVCGNWASFVLQQNKDGLSADQIGSVWSVVTSKNGAAQETTIMSQCGSVADILAAAGRS